MKTSYAQLIFVYKNFIIMKKHILILFLSFLGFNTFSQAGLEIGLDIMPQTYWIMNKADFDLGDDLNHIPSYGLAVGAHVALNFTDKLGLQTGVLYSQQGQKYEQEFNVNNINEYEKKLTYLKIPLLLKFNGDPDAGAYFVGMIGPQLGLLTNAETEGNVPTGLRIPDDKDAYKSADIGGVLALGVGINLTDALNLGILFRFDGSLGDIENKDDFWNEPFHATRESAQNVTGGIMFSLNYVLN